MLDLVHPSLLGAHPSPSFLFQVFRTQLESRLDHQEANVSLAHVCLSRIALTLQKRMTFALVIGNGNARVVHWSPMINHADIIVIVISCH